ncbi:4-hydroxy-tetrahydrodipicolinate synthase [Terribacillus saccharophilus]|uniref:4-hydroxy-tetrahydrodipicolinate synthase n=1 Tax=Terribacillus saccharophilus TaxID=361277 RepID=UPI0039825C55
MEQVTQFHGIIPPVSTIMDEKGQLDKSGMTTLIDYLIDSGVNGLFFLGTGGEFSQMSKELRKEVAAFAIEHVQNRVPVLIGTGSPSTTEAIELSQHAQKAGADGVVIINPYYWSLSEANLFQHYQEIAEQIELPIILYNFPALTGQDLTPDMVLRLATQFPHIIGIKDTVDSIAHTREIIMKVKPIKPSFKVFCGYDDQLLNTLALGGDGAIPATANFVPELTTGIYKAFAKQNYQEVMSLHQQLAPLMELYKLDSPFVGIVKEALRQRNIAVSPYVLPPAAPPNKDLKQQISIILQSSIPSI